MSNLFNCTFYIGRLRVQTFFTRFWYANSEFTPFSLTFSSEAYINSFEIRLCVMNFSFMVSYYYGKSSQAEEVDKATSEFLRSIRKDTGEKKSKDSLI